MSLVSELRAELDAEGFSIRDETFTNVEYSAKNAEGEDTTVYIDFVESSVCLSEFDDAGRLSRAEKFMLRSRGQLATVIAEVFKTI